jgi:hypothetical protein
MVNNFPVPSRDVTKKNSSCPGIIKLFPARESLVSDIPAGDGKIVNLVLQCTQYFFKKALVISFRRNNEMFTSFAKIKPD